MTQTKSYAKSQILLHWLMAVVVFGLFGVGFWMVDLTYYSEWYRIAPHWHQSVGFLLALAWVSRIVLLRIHGKPAPLESHKPAEIRAAHFTHALLYLLMLCLFISGYLISTADGRAIAIFNWFELPGLGELFAEQADISGTVHQYAAYGLIALVVIHAAGALKHHLIDKDDTLNRILGRTKPQPSNYDQEQ